MLDAFAIYWWSLASSLHGNLSARGRIRQLKFFSPLGSNLLTSCSANVFISKYTNTSERCLSKTCFFRFMPSHQSDIPTVGQTSFSDILGPTLKSINDPESRNRQRSWAIPRLQKPQCRTQSVRKRSLTHHSMRQSQGFPAYFE